MGVEIDPSKKHGLLFSPCVNQPTFLMLTVSRLGSIPADAPHPQPGLAALLSWPPAPVALQWAPGGRRRLRAFRSGAVARLALDVGSS